MLLFDSFTSAVGIDLICLGQEGDRRMKCRRTSLALRTPSRSARRRGRFSRPPTASISHDAVSLETPRRTRADTHTRALPLVGGRPLTSCCMVIVLGFDRRLGQERFRFRARGTSRTQTKTIHANSIKSPNACSPRSIFKARSYNSTQQHTTTTARNNSIQESILLPTDQKNNMAPLNPAAAPFYPSSSPTTSYISEESIETEVRVSGGGVRQGSNGDVLFGRKEEKEEGNAAANKKKHRAFVLQPQPVRTVAPPRVFPNHMEDEVSQIIYGSWGWLPERPWTGGKGKGKGSVEVSSFRTLVLVLPRDPTSPSLRASERSASIRRTRCSCLLASAPGWFPARRGPTQNALTQTRVVVGGSTTPRSVAHSPQHPQTSPRNQPPNNTNTNKSSSSSSP